MKKNVGSLDKIIRLVIGFVIAIWGIVNQNWWGLVAIIPFFTAFVNWCPLYVPFKISTRKE